MDRRVVLERLCGAVALTVLLGIVLLYSWTQESSATHFALSTNDIALHDESNFALCTSNQTLHEEASVHETAHETTDYAHKAAVADTFASFRQQEGCSASKAEMYDPFEPKCGSKKSVLEAMSGGGRHGWDQPYGTLGCDMEWFSTAEICDILSHFDHIHLVGDSLMRQIILAIHMLLREDLIEGARQTWKDGNPEDQDCRCATIFAKSSKCFWFEAIETKAIWDQDPESMKCRRDTASFNFNQIPDDSFIADARDYLIDGIEEGLQAPSKGRNVYVIGVGSWHAYDTPRTQNYIHILEEGMLNRLPSYFERPRLWISPAAPGENKPDRFIDFGGNHIRVTQHVHQMGPFVESLGYDHLATYNVTLQQSSADGTHATMQTTLIEAMMLLNWLKWVAVEDTSPVENRTRS